MTETVRMLVFYLAMCTMLSGTYLYLKMSASGPKGLGHPLCQVIAASTVHIL